MEGSDGKRRGRRLFGARRRPDEPVETPADDSEVSDLATPSTPTSPSEPASAAAVPGAAPALPNAAQPPAAEPARSDRVAASASVVVPSPDQGTVDSPGSATADAAAPRAVPGPEVTRAVTEPSAPPASAQIVGGSVEPTPPQAPEPAADYELPRIIAIANQKGGVGKTTTSVNLGAALAELDFRVLVIDLDPQGNATTGLGINARNLQASIYDVVMNDAALEDCIEPTSLKNLFLAPATIDLAGAEIELVPAFSRELKLRRALEEIRDEYDYVIIDCPPSLGLLTVNGLAAADDVIVPIQCEYYALEGLSQLVRNVELVQKNLNRGLDVRGIVLTMYDARTKLADQVEKEVRNHFGPRVYQTVVPRTVRLSEAPSFGQPIILFDPTSRGAVAYRELAKEVSSGATRRAG